MAVDPSALKIRERAVLEVFDHSGDAPLLVKTVETVHENGELISREVTEHETNSKQEYGGS